MPAKSQAQQRFMGMVHAAQKKGGKAASPEVAKVAKGMKKKDAKEFASTKHKGLPKKITEDSNATRMKGTVWKDKTHEDKPWAAKNSRTGKVSYFNTKPDAVKHAGYKTMGRMHEAKDETMRQGDKGKAPRGYDQPSWDWKIHSKGSHWQSRPSSGTGLKVPGWGARAKSGEVDYFPDKSKAMQFAKWANPNTRPGSYVRGNFAKGRNEGIQKVREYVRSVVREALMERRSARREAYDPAAEGERASKLDNLAAKHGLKMRKGESRDEFEDRVSNATQ